MVHYNQIARSSDVRCASDPFRYAKCGLRKFCISHSEMDCRLKGREMLKSEKLKWHLARLYSTWDEISHSLGQPLDADALSVVTDRDVLGYPAGTALAVIADWMESQNERFNTGDVLRGVRLTPLTTRGTRMPVYDKHGIQVCKGDQIRTQICIAPYGKVRVCEFLIKKAYADYGVICGALDGSNACYQFNPYCVDGFDIGYKHYADAEHGHTTWAEVVTRATQS